MEKNGEDYKERGIEVNRNTIKQWPIKNIAQNTAEI